MNNKWAKYGPNIKEFSLVGCPEDELAGWHHQLNGHEFEQIPGDSEGQRSLAVHKESDTT